MRSEAIRVRTFVFVVRESAFRIRGSAEFYCFKTREVWERRGFEAIFKAQFQEIRPLPAMAAPHRPRSRASRRRGTMPCGRDQNRPRWFASIIRVQCGRRRFERAPRPVSSTTVNVRCRFSTPPQTAAEREHLRDLLDDEQRGDLQPASKVRLAVRQACDSNRPWCPWL